MTADLPPYRSRFLHLTALWAYGVSQPVLAIIDGNPDLLLARGATRLNVVLFAAFVALVPPALAVAYIWLAGRASRWVGDVLYLAVLSVFLAPLAARAVKLFDPGLVAATCLVAVIAVAGVAAYARSRAARLFLGYSIVLPLVGLVWFVHGLPVLTENAQAARVRVTSPTPVVFLVLDELPASSLMTRSGEIDAARYPNFARLARDATWYRNATTVHEWTSDAVPSILTGGTGSASSLPTVNHYPENLFTLLGGAYALRVHEIATRLCPTRYCPRSTDSFLEGGYGIFVDSTRLLIPRIFPGSISDRLFHVNQDIELQDESSQSITGFDALLTDVSRAGPDSTLYFDHLLLPHAPWRFLPSGTQYDSRGIDGWFPDEHWGDDAWLVLQGYQRHLLQLGYVDRLLGQLLRRLERNGLYDRAMVVVVADHGVSFRAGQGRRPLTGHNLADVTNVPMFVKYPGQEHGRSDSRPARTVDLLPTVADVLGIRLPWSVDGVSLLGPLPRGRDVVVGRRGGTVLHASLASMIRDRAVTVRHKVAEFGEGSDSLYAIGTHRALVGREVTGSGEVAGVQVRIDGGRSLAQVRRASGYVPARISGHVTRGQIDPRAELAVAVNGRVQALTRCFRSGGVERFRALVPETAFRDGANTVEVFLVRGQGRGATLVSVGSNG